MSNQILSRKIYQSSKKNLTPKRFLKMNFIFMSFDLIILLILLIKILGTISAYLWRWWLKWKRKASRWNCQSLTTIVKKLQIIGLTINRTVSSLVFMWKSGKSSIVLVSWPYFGFMAYNNVTRRDIRILVLEENFLRDAWQS